jgi:hypothetical protein
MLLPILPQKTKGHGVRRWNSNLMNEERVKKIDRA